MKIKVGDKAPDFTLPSQMGDNVTLSEFFGKKNIVLYFYPKDESRGCTKEACSFRGSYDVLTSLGAEVIGVSARFPIKRKQFDLRGERETWIPRICGSLALTI